MISARLPSKISLAELSSAPTVTSGFWGATLSFKADERDDIQLKGTKPSEAEQFSSIVQQDWQQFHQSQWQDRHAEIEAIIQRIAALNQASSYPAACLVEPLLVQARKLDTTLLSNLPKDAMAQQHLRNIEIVQGFIKAAKQVRGKAIGAFQQRELTAWAEFFDTFESNPLTPEQRLSIVTDEDATLVLAGAGSGKTSVITAKAGYLLKSGIRKPEEVLLLAFARDAAKEMSERIEAKCGAPLEARTFHSLAYEIIGSVEGSKPALAAHATDDKAFLALIREILMALVRTASEVSKSIVGWFSHARLENKSEWDFKKKHAYYTYVEKLDLRTLQGEQVKSFEELMIANWLYENGIEYEYEPDYEHKVSEGGYRDYCPDFRLTKSGVYIEHFGVRRDNEGNLTTAPFVDRSEYLESMEWKRGVHAEHETTLVETFSYERSEGRLLDALAEKIAPYETVSPRSPDVLFDRIVELNQADNFVQLIGTFLRHYKGGGYQLEECAAKRRGAKAGQASPSISFNFQTSLCRISAAIGWPDRL